MSAQRCPTTWARSCSLRTPTAFLSRRVLCSLRSRSHRSRRFCPSCSVSPQQKRLRGSSYRDPTLFSVSAHSGSPCLRASLSLISFPRSMPSPPRGPRSPSSPYFPQSPLSPPSSPSTSTSISQHGSVSVSSCFPSSGPPSGTSPRSSTPSAVSSAGHPSTAHRATNGSRPGAVPSPSTASSAVGPFWPTVRSARGSSARNHPRKGRKRTMAASSSTTLLSTSTSSLSWLLARLSLPRDRASSSLPS